MQNTVEVIINEDGKSCTTLNPLGKRPTLVRGQFVRFECETIDEAKTNHEAWQQAESERKKYEIVCDGCKGTKTENFSDWYQNCSGCNGSGLQKDVTVRSSIMARCRTFEPGEIHQAKIINNKAVII